MFSCCFIPPFTGHVVASISFFQFFGSSFDFVFSQLNVSEALSSACRFRTFHVILPKCFSVCVRRIGTVSDIIIAPCYAAEAMATTVATMLPAKMCTAMT